MRDFVPSLMGALSAVSAPLLPGPTREEWGGAVVGVVALLVREFFWWLRNRKA